LRQLWTGTTPPAEAGQVDTPRRYVILSIEGNPFGLRHQELLDNFQ
jgi:hypothetical protein